VLAKHILNRLFEARTDKCRLHTYTLPYPWDECDIEDGVIVYVGLCKKKKFSHQELKV
jgi:hypothetical protein